MKKLELKHLAPYLPYGVRIKYNNGETSTLTQELMRDTAGFLNSLMNVFKPILRPLSDLTKEIEHNREMFVPIEFGCNGMEDEFKKIMNPTGYCTEYLVISRLRYDAVQKLIEWHFDVFDLLKHDLAIDINTLEK